MKNLSFINRLKFAWTGIRSAFKTEASFRTQSIFAVLAFILLAVLRPEPIWWGLMILTMAMVLMAELFNTSLEYLMDHVHPQRHEMIRIAKDCAAGAVLIGSLASLGVLVSILVERFVP